MGAAPLRPKDGSEFIRLAAQTLQEIERRIEASRVDADCGYAGGGVPVVEFEDGSKIIVNIQDAVREIWVAARSGGHHFIREHGRWVSARDGTELFASLSACISQQSGQVADLAGES